jgi:hypothetical protein
MSAVYRVRFAVQVSRTCFLYCLNKIQARFDEPGLFLFAW